MTITAKLRREIRNEKMVPFCDMSRSARKYLKDNKKQVLRSYDNGATWENPCMCTDCWEYNVYRIPLPVASKPKRKDNHCHRFTVTVKARNEAWAMTRKQAEVALHTCLNKGFAGVEFNLTRRASR